MVRVNEWANNDKPCVKCGKTERKKPRKGRFLGRCLFCDRSYQGNYRATHKDEQKIAHAKWYGNNSERVNLRTRQWSINNPKKVKAYQAKHRAKRRKQAKGST